ncbi:UvrD-helicase domain-containing protein [Actinoplanes rectilineatus]|uniref:UvrD-helicase domain-containing protein n=1 Tax=Actinoplanes rectilineatus TaxID=113571 RepID=UPI000A71C27D|nr:ATP-dependent helicase [Actinoplanes rectilineatus]
MPLNNEQRAALWDHHGKPVSGQRILSARPGTGKTTTLTSYCIDLVEHWHERHQPWQGIAMLSYTNVAKDEIEHKIRKLGKAEALLQNPHFVGTVDAFLNQYIFLPHGTRPMAFTGERPKLTGEPYQQWKNHWALDNTKPSSAYSTMWFDCYTIGLNGKPLRIDATPRPAKPKPVIAQPVTDANTAKIVATKRHVWSTGLALQADANYLAYQALLTSPALTSAIIRRFPVLIIDEAQDLTDIQHAIVDHLITAGLRHVVLVGDENQAIYEWNTARPELFTAKATAGPPWTSHALTASYRCSPAICTTLTALAGDGSQLAPAEDGKNRTYPAPVTVRPFAASDGTGELKAAIDELAATLSKTTPHDGNETNVKTLLILARGAEHARQLEAAYSGITATATKRTVWEDPLTRDFLRVLYLINISDQYAAVEAYETLLRKLGDHRSTADMRTAAKRALGIAEDEGAAYRIALFDDLKELEAALSKEPCSLISDCAAICTTALRAIPANRSARFEKDCAGFAADDKKEQDRLLSSLFGAREARHWIKHSSYSDVHVAFATAHASKGETHDAVLLVVKSRTLSCGCPQSAAMWNKILKHSMTECETKRIVYVALSRAAQNLMILAPAGSDECWRDLTREALL